MEDRLSIDSAIRILESSLGRVLRIEDLRLAKQDRILRGHIFGLNRLPAPFLARLRRRGLEAVRIGNGAVSDFSGYEYLTEEEVPTENYSWSAVRGLYDSSSRVVLLGNAPVGIEDTAVHEVGHATGHLLGYNEDGRVWKAYEGVLQHLPDFYKENNSPCARGCKEFFAEAFRLGIIYQERAKASLPPELVEVLLDEVLGGKWRGFGNE